MSPETRRKLDRLNRLIWNLTEQRKVVYDSLSLHDLVSVSQLEAIRRFRDGTASKTGAKCGLALARGIVTKMQPEHGDSHMKVRRARCPRDLSSFH